MLSLSNRYFSIIIFNIFQNKKNNQNNQNQQSKKVFSDPEANGEQKQMRHAIWLQERKQLRNGLNNLDLNREYLQRKKKLNECELRVLKQLEDAIETQDSKVC